MPATIAFIFLVFNRDVQCRAPDRLGNARLRCDEFELILRKLIRRPATGFGFNRDLPVGWVSCRTSLAL
jgi:hypothetical protein